MAEARYEITVITDHSEHSYEFTDLNEAWAHYIKLDEALSENANVETELALHDLDNGRTICEANHG